ncbi:hypothetical protein ACEWY4_011269 [Coilia grayii]|uniref:WW domain-containing protein n=1 Tax=Coilia grayii TaxID=363190 RepID=A0ABD1K498_9TELE
MAADLNPDWISCLPSSWSYGVTRDGRIFFINEEAKSTTWLHPVSGEAIITGHRKTPDLPTGWEEGFTFEGARCFIKGRERLSCNLLMSTSARDPETAAAVDLSLTPLIIPPLIDCLARSYGFAQGRTPAFLLPQGDLSRGQLAEPGSALFVAGGRPVRKLREE